MDQESQSRWVHCPICRSKTRIKVYKDTVLLNFPLFCPKCKQEHNVSIIQMKMVINDEPEIPPRPRFQYKHP